MQSENFFFKKKTVVSFYNSKWYTNDFIENYKLINLYIFTIVLTTTTTIDYYI